MATRTIDPTQISDPSQIPPAGATLVGVSAQGLAEVYCGTLAGDVDAQPAAKELLGTGLDTGALSNIDYIYTQVAALYGGATLPSFRSPSGRDVRAIVFVSGSSQGGYGAFHIEGSQPGDFDRIVVDSLNASGNYSAGSGLGAALAPARASSKRLILDVFRGPANLLSVSDTADPILLAATPDDIRKAYTFACQSIAALKVAIEFRNPAHVTRGAYRISSHKPNAGKEELARALVLANREIAGLLRAATGGSSPRQYLSTAFFAAEVVESFQLVTSRADPGKTDGEAASRVIAFKLAPEIALVPGFNGGVTQQWWSDGHPDFVNDNSQDDRSTDGNAAGVMFLEFLTDYLGVPLDQVIQHMPASGGAALGQTYVNLLTDFPQIRQIAGADGKAAFNKMISLLQQHAQAADGSLTLPANGNPFPGMPGAVQGGLFQQAPVGTGSGSMARNSQAALDLEVRLEQQLAAVRNSLQQIQALAAGAGSSTPGALGESHGLGARRSAVRRSAVAANDEAEAFAYRAPLPASIVARLEQQLAPYRAPEYDQSLQQVFWPHVYNELPGTGTNTDRLQVITGTNQTPVAVQITGTVTRTKLEPDGDLHISFQPDDPAFPTNQGQGESPLELEIIYAGPVTQADARQAGQGYTNPFDISQLKAGARIQAVGPFIFDRAHGTADSSGQVQSGLEIHPIAGLSVLSGVGATGSPAPAPGGGGPLSAELSAAIAQLGTLGQSVANLTRLLQTMQSDVL